MVIWLGRMPKWEPLIRAQLISKGLPGDLAYLPLIESGYSNTAVSRSKAVGMWQFMRGTGKWYGLRIDSWVDERREPFRATSTAIRYLSDLTTRFGSPFLAAAAYNGGPGRVGRGLARLDIALTDAAFAWPPPAALVLLGAAVVFTSVVSGLTYVLRWSARAWHVAHGAG
jgi:soluble lytic murein transglycosylase-like protein